MHIRTMARRAGVVAGIVGLVMGATAGVASASTSITQPTQNPFHAPGDALGNPVAFTVSATGFLPQDTQVYVEVCDGVSPSSAGYSVTDHCDLGTSPAPVSSDANGNVTWDANSPQASKRFKPFKGESPQSQFNCLSPNDPSMTPVNGLTDYTNCQLRVSTNNSTATPDQVYLPFVLPDAKPHCDVNGTVKISPGVTGTASVKAVKLTYKGTFTNCVGFDGFTGAKLPISGGTFSATIGGLNLGSTCNNIFTGFGAKPSAKLSFKMTGLKAGKPAAATGSTAAVISTVTEQANPFGHTATAATINNVKSLFDGLTPKLTIKYDETQAQRDALCATPKKGMGLLHFGNVTDKTLGAFTPVNGASIFELD